MKITKKTYNIMQSEVFRELSRNAAKKGFFDASEEDIVKNASKKIIRKATGNLDVDISN